MYELSMAMAANPNRMEKVTAKMMA